MSIEEACRVVLATPAPQPALAEQGEAAQPAAEGWAMLYLHDWDPPKEGQEHRWEPGKNVFPECHAIYTTLEQAEAERKQKISPEKYWIVRAKFASPGIASQE